MNVENQRQHQQQAGLVNVARKIQENSVVNVENQHQQENGSVQNVVQKIQENFVRNVERLEDNVCSYI